MSAENTGRAEQVEREAEAEKLPEHPCVYCPNCSERLTEHKCKLVCRRCGYYMSCADYY
jgi:hypothetical protein